MTRRTMFLVEAELGAEELPSMLAVLPGVARVVDLSLAEDLAQRARQLIGEIADRPVIARPSSVRPGRQVEGEVLDCLRQGAGWMTSREVAKEICSRRSPVDLALALLARTGRAERRLNPPGKVRGSVGYIFLVPARPEGRTSASEGPPAAADQVADTDPVKARVNEVGT